MIYQVAISGADSIVFDGPLGLTVIRVTGTLWTLAEQLDAH
jgi:hypothetical protein